jgi:hypothetical protein
LRIFRKSFLFLESDYSLLNGIELIMRLSNRAILLLIIAVGAILRFYRFPELPYMHDEFSALFRTDFDGFSELIKKGVKIDGHPAGVQVFLFYWTKLFGSSEWIVKLPFTLMGTFSILLIFLVARRWFNETVALISAAFLATIQYTIMYSQIARPYISGLFLSLLMVWFWSKLMEPSPKNFRKNALLFVITASLCSYNHHFSLLFAAIVGLSGLFLINRKYMAGYILSGIAIVVLYIPHLNIFYYQLKTGGVEGWLAKPENTFLADYMYYIFNFSFLSVLTAIALILFGFFHLPKRYLNYKSLALFASWFLIPIITGFYYSRYFSAVLQYSVLIFSFFALFFVLFGHIRNQTPRMNLTLVSIILAVNSFTLITERKHYFLFYNSAFERIITDYHEVTLSRQSIVSIIDSHKRITAYYLNKYESDSNFVWFDSFKNEAGFIRFLDEQSKKNEYLYFGALSSNKPNTVPIIQDYFPDILVQNNYFLGTTYLFSGTGTGEPEYLEKLNFQADDLENWRSVNTEFYVDTVGFGDIYSYRMDSISEWSPTFATNLEPMITHENNYIDVSVSVKVNTYKSELLLVATLESNGETFHFSGADFENFVDSDKIADGWITMYHSLKLSDVNLNYQGIVLNVFVWNKGRNSFFMDNFRIRAREGNPFIYGLYEKIP